MPKVDGLLESQKRNFSVIPAKAGIQQYDEVKNFLDPGDPVPAKSGNQGDDFLRDHQS